MAWRRAREGWREEARARPNLEAIRRLMNCRYKTRCVEIGCKRQGRMLMKQGLQSGGLKLTGGVD